MPASIDFTACALLGTASAALVGRAFVQVQQGYTQPAQLWLAMTGDSGMRKTPTLNKFVGPLRKWLMEERGKVDPFFDKPSTLETITTDATPEALAALMARHNGKAIVFTDEGSAMEVLTGMTYRKVGAGANIDALLQSYDGGLVSVARKLADSSFDIPEAHMSLTIGMQPNVLENLSGNMELASRGFPQRLLYFLPEPMGHYVIRDLPQEDPELLTAWEEKVRGLASAFREQPVTLTMTEAAHACFQDFAQLMIDERFGDLGGHEAIVSWCLKAAGKVARLALILTLLENVDADCVDAPAVEAAVGMMRDYFIPHMKRVYYGERKLSHAAKALFRSLVKMGNETGGVVPQSQLKQRTRGQKQFKGDAGAESFRAALEELARAGYIRKIPSAVPDGAGRRGDGAWEVRDVFLDQPKEKFIKAEKTVTKNFESRITPGIPTYPLDMQQPADCFDYELPFEKSPAGEKISGRAINVNRSDEHGS